MSSIHNWPPLVEPTKKSAPKVSVNTKAIGKWFIHTVWLTAINCSGLTDEMVDTLKGDPQLQDMLKLHEYVQKIKNRHYEVKTQVGELKQMFGLLEKQMSDVAK